MDTGRHNPTARAQNTRLKGCYDDCRSERSSISHGMVQEKADEALPLEPVDVCGTLAYEIKKLLFCLSTVIASMRFYLQ
jgi:hypothetical protein